MRQGKRRNGKDGKNETKAEEQATHEELSRSEKQTYAAKLNLKKHFKKDVYST
jgi:hypothetical protein